jgi:type IV pilus assembly protein PilY1
MRIRIAHSLATLTALVVGWSTSASAQQVDTNPPVPNVLILLDNSGSMERMINGNPPENDPNPSTPSGTNQCNCVDNGAGTAPTCNFAAGASPTPNRWATVQQAFTGSLAQVSGLTNGFSCVAMPRTTSATSTFVSEYQINGVAPYDTNYYLPFHRMVVPDPNAAGATTQTPGACVVAPGALDGASTGQGVGVHASANPNDNATGFSGSCANGQCSGSIVTREYAQLNNPVTCTFAQNSDGALTQMKDLMRFALMTFDQDPDPGTGVNSGNMVNTTPFTGMWSYFPGWNSGGTCNYNGNPVACSSSTLMSVGARNPGAPAWEGRMVPFSTKFDITSQEQNNSEVSSVILATRPYGATPMAGMFVGAQYYLQNDPNGPNSSTAGVGDPFVKGGCRPEFIILLTDGAPNLDMQPGCSATSAAGDAGSSPAGKCPFPLPQTTAATLYNNGVSSGGNPSIQTFVIGFAVSNVVDGTTPSNCSQYAQGNALAGLCNCNSPSLPQLTDPTYGNIGPCCELQCIAQSGGTKHAYFADTQGDLNNALGSILGSIASNATTRTTPSYSPVLTTNVASQSTPTTASSVYLSSLTPSLSQPWSGDIQRQEMVCSYNSGSYNVTPTINSANGDDFAMNVDSHTGPARNFIAYVPATTSSSTVDATATIRPYVLTTVGDGLGQYSATQYAGSATTVIPNITSGALGIPSTGSNAGCAYVSNQFGGGQKYLTPSLCATMLLDYTFGQSTFAGGPTDFTFVSRYNDALGDIFHANPVVVGPPGSLLQDPTYVAFQQTWQTSSSTQTSTWSTPTGGRKTAIYAATNDGLLHAFWADETKLENNEMWAMLPPAVMPHLLSTYPSSHEFLLDGSPIVKDVVWDRNSSASAGSIWHTMLVAGYGQYQQGFYAVDVTNPDPTGMSNGVVPSDPGQNGPVLRWQLTKMPTTNYQIFGSQSATPAITTLYFDPGDGHGARDIGVAILPGGQNGNPTSSLGNGTSCARASTTSTPDSAPPSGYAYRSAVRCWGTASSPPKSTDPVPGRSVTIVRIDTGEIIRVFARKADAVAATNDTILNATPTRLTDTPLDSPMTGTPIVYPTDVGTDATKFFIGDSDGTIWKFDVSSSDPSQWTGQLFLDLYNTTVDPNTTTSWGDGQPFQVDPVLSLDPQGELVINAATGSIQQYDNTGIELVYSITEKVQGSPAKLRANVNWWLGPVGLNGATVGFQSGERVSGPMTVFAGTLYFSTYAAAASSSTSCSSGVASLWGRNYVTPDNSTDLSQGGQRVLQPPPPAAPQTPPPVSVQPPVQAGAVIPGVSILGTPACSGLGTAQPDQYVAGATHQMPQNFTAGSYSLFTQVGAKGTNGVGSVQQFQQSLQTPASPTSIDSWAAVLE